MSRAVFFKQFFSNNQVGSIAPSSKFLVNMMLKNVDFKKARIIVEFGAGEGVITKQILQYMRKDATLIVLEINKVFFDILSKINDDRLVLANDKAQNIKKYIKKHSMSQDHKADYIISSLPLSVLSNYAGTYILKNSFNSIKDDGLFIQYQYSLGDYIKLKKIFSKVKLNFVPLNLPPAFVYTCNKKP